jgi:dienelactone hydrolase
VANLLGSSPDQIAGHYKQASPSELLPLGVPQILIYGAEDQAVPEKFCSAYMQSARKKGENAKLITVKDAAHHEYNVPNSVAWPAVRSAVLSLLR